MPSPFHLLDNFPKVPKLSTPSNPYAYQIGYTFDLNSSKAKKSTTSNPIEFEKYHARTYMLHILVFVIHHRLFGLTPIASREQYRIREQYFDTKTSTNNSNTTTRKLRFLPASLQVMSSNKLIKKLNEEYINHIT